MIYTTIIDICALAKNTHRQS